MFNHKGGNDQPAYLKQVTDNFCQKIYTFRWGKTEMRQAEVIHCRTNSFIRFHWLDDTDPKSFFELRIVYNELTEDLMLEVTDMADAGETEDLRDLWDSDIEKLKRVSGL